MLNKLFRNNGWVVSVGKGLGSVLFPCPVAGQFLRTDTLENGISWWGCGNYGWNVYQSATYDIFTDGNCGEIAQMTGSYHAPSGHVFYDTGCCQVHYDGGTSYYIVDNCNPCAPSGTPTGNTAQGNIESVFWIGCNQSGLFNYAYDNQVEYHDGNCTTYWVNESHVEATQGELLYENSCCYVEYTYRGSYTVYDSCGDPPPPPPCEPAGSYVDSSSGNLTLDWEGCGTSGTFTYGNWTSITYTDGSCGTYVDYNEEKVQAGTIIYDGCCQVIFDGVNSYNVYDNCGDPPPCESAGTATGGTQATNGSNFNWFECGNSGTFYYDGNYEEEYHDGNCGTYWMVVNFWQATAGDVIYDNGCCSVIYNGSGGHTVNDTCEPPPPCDGSGNLISSDSGQNTWDWSGCESGGTFAYETWTSQTYTDGNCGTYTDVQTFPANNGDVIYDNGCCQVVFDSSTGWYTVNDNCGDPEPPPPDPDPEEGTVLSSSSEPIEFTVEHSGLDFDTEMVNSGSEIVQIGSNYSIEYADGQGGSYFDTGSTYQPDGSLVYQSIYGQIFYIPWAVTDDGGTYSGIQKVGLDVPSWVMQGESVVSGDTSFIDKLASGYTIFETNSWFNGDANVKTRVEYTGGKAWITTTITF